MRRRRCYGNYRKSFLARVTSNRIAKGGAQMLAEGMPMGLVQMSSAALLAQYDPRFTPYRTLRKKGLC